MWLNNYNQVKDKFYFDYSDNSFRNGYTLKMWGANKIKFQNKFEHLSNFWNNHQWEFIEMKVWRIKMFANCYQ